MKLCYMLGALGCSLVTSLAGCARSSNSSEEAASGEIPSYGEVKLAAATTATVAAPATKPRRSSVLQKVAAAKLPPAPSGLTSYVPRRYAIGASSVAVELPGGFPGKIAQVSANGSVSTETGLLAADVALRFRSEDGRVVAESLDGKVSYRAVERVTAAAPWAEKSPGSGCCGWWESTLWRADGEHLDAGLLRAVTPPHRSWSVIDFHSPGSAEPRWRATLTEGKRSVVAAGVAPRGKAVALVLADGSGASVLQTRDASNGKERWTTPLSTPAEGWRSGKGELVYSKDGAQLAVLVQSPNRCESCSAIELFDATSGKKLRRLELSGVVSPEHSRLGFSDGAVWIFEHVPAATTDMSSRPVRSQYEAFDLSSGARRPAPDATWQLENLWALAPNPAGAGVIALGWRTSGELLWLRADSAP